MDNLNAFLVLRPRGLLFKVGLIQVCLSRRASFTMRNVIVFLAALF
jgi:hypothetical protein